MHLGNTANRHDIIPERIDPGTPQQKGRQERKRFTLKQEAIASFKSRRWNQARASRLFRLRDARIIFLINILCSDCGIRTSE